MPKRQFPLFSIRRMCGLLAAGLFLLPMFLAAQVTVNFTTTQAWTVPAGVTSVHVVALGTKGSGSSGGLGGKVECDLAVTPGSVLNINVAGAADIRIDGTALTDRVIVAGGGGNSASERGGGAGGGLIGMAGFNYNSAEGGGGGTQAAGGAGGSGSGGNGNDGTLGTGGLSIISGGDGYYGGGGGGTEGGGDEAGGGGGSSYTNSSCTNVVHTQGANSGAASITLSYCPATGSTRYVATTPSGTGDGSSWANASADLQAMINATCVEQVWVKTGTYKPTTTTDRNISFSMKDGVAIYGGFDGSETMLSERDWVANPTILSGDIGTAGDNSDNTNHVVSGLNISATAILDGFSIIGGAGAFFGGGIFLQNASPVIANCIISGNNSFQGAGIYHDGGNLTLNNCRVTGNSGVSVSGLFEAGSVSMTNCLFYDNIATSGTITEINMQVSGTNATLVNCTFSNHTGSILIRLVTDANMTMKNCIVWGIPNPLAYSIYGGGFTVSNSIVQGGFAGTGNLDLDPLFVSATDFSLQNCSPAIDAGLDADNPTMTDLVQNPRKFEAVPGGQMIDMGAFERQLLNVTQLTSFSVSNLGTCNPNGTTCPTDDYFTADVLVNYSAIAATGTLDMVSASLPGGIFSTPVSDLSGTSHLFTGVRFLSDGNPMVGLRVQFSAASGCFLENTNIGTAPAQCSLTGGPVADIVVTGNAVFAGTYTYGGFVDGSHTYTSSGGKKLYHPELLYWYLEQGGSNLEIAFGSATQIPCNGWSDNDGNGAPVLSGNCDVPLPAPPPCSISAISLTDQSGCQNNGTPTGADDYFTADVKVLFNFAPITGDLVLKKGATVLATKPSSELGCVTEWTFDDVQMPTDGGPITLTGDFGSCTFTSASLGTAPAACPYAAISDISMGNFSGCNTAGTNCYTADDYFTADVTVFYNQLPTGAGNITLTGNNLLGAAPTVAYAAAGPTSHTFTGVKFYVANGLHNLSASFTGDSPFEKMFVPGQVSCARTGIPAPLLVSLMPTGQDGFYVYQGEENGAAWFYNAAANWRILYETGAWAFRPNFIGGGYSGTPVEYVFSTDPTQVPCTGWANGTTVLSGCDMPFPGFPGGGTEICNGIDDDCDGLIDEDVPSGVINLFVKPVASGTGDGTSWANATANLQGAIDNLCGIPEIWVAEGTYKPSALGDRNASFKMKEGVGIFGGFDGSETMRSERDCSGLLTILSGDIGTVGDSTDNSYHVIFNNINGLTAAAILDGFTITGGNANGPNPDDSRGGGMFNYGSSPTVAHCTFTGNTAIGDGGGMYLGGGPQTTVVTNCNFINNRGGAGGALKTDVLSAPVLTNCLFAGNLAEVGGAIQNTFLASAIFINCTVAGNTASIVGGGVISEFNFMSFKNCIIWGNNSGSNFQNATVEYSTIEGGWPGTGNLDMDPLFVSATDFRLTDCSPALDAGLDAENATTEDLDKLPRKFEAIASGEMIDMGAYEYQSLGSERILSIVASNPSACDDQSTSCTTDDTYTADVTVTYSSKPATGTLDLSGADLVGTPPSAAVSGIGATSHTFTGVTLRADGAAIGLMAAFSDPTFCPLTVGNAGTAASGCGMVFNSSFADVVVTGFPFFNGTYVYNGMLNGSPSFTESDGRTLYYTPAIGRWRFQGIFGNDQSFHPGSSAFTLPCTGWLDGIELSGGCGPLTVPAPCDISSIMLSDLTACQNQNTADPGDDFYTADVKVNFTFAPTTGNLTLKQGATVLATKPAADLACETMWTFDNVQLPADGMDIVLTGDFGSCTFTSASLGTAPGPCPPCVPTITCSDATVYLGTNGQVDLTPKELVVNLSIVSYDGMGPGAYSILNAANQSLASGTLQENNPVSVVLPGAAGPLTLQITSDDQVNYSVTCAGATTLNGTGYYSFNVAIPTCSNVPFVIGGNCPTAIVTTAPPTLNCSNLGANSVVTTVSNGMGGSNSCTSTITVLDTIKPAMDCVSGQKLLVAADGSLRSTYAVSINHAYPAFPSWSLVDAGNNVVASGGVGYFFNILSPGGPLTFNVSSTGSISGEDVTYQVSCSTGGLLLQGAIDISGGSFSGPVFCGDSPIAPATDNCGTPTVTYAPALGCPTLGTTLVTFTATDASGNTATCQTEVTVEDRIAPVLNCFDQTIYVSADGTLVSFYEVNISTFYTDGNPNWSLVDGNGIIVASGGVGNFPNIVSPGTPLTFNLTETGSNADNQAFYEVLCSSSGTLLAGSVDDGAGNFSAPVFCSNSPNAPATDNCGTATVTSTPVLDCTNAGPNTVTFTATDPSGNASTCNATVTVVGPITNIAISNHSACDTHNTTCATDDTYTADLGISYLSIPATGNLTISSPSLVNSPITIPVGSLSGTNHTIAGVEFKADGMPILFTAVFSALPSCVLTDFNAGTAPAACSSLIAVTEVEVTNANLDGTYAYNGLFNGKPSYSLGSYSIIWEGTRWEYHNQVQGLRHSNPSADNTQLPCTGWVDGLDNPSVILTSGCDVPLFAPPACDISSIVLSDVTACNNNGTTATGDDFYTADVKVNFAFAPTTGNLTLMQGATVLATKSAADLACATMWTFDNVQLPADGLPIILTGDFGSCTFTSGSLGTAPGPCPCVPTITCSDATVYLGTNGQVDLTPNELVINLTLLAADNPGSYSILNTANQIVASGVLPNDDTPHQIVLPGTGEPLTLQVNSEENVYYSAFCGATNIISGTGHADFTVALPSCSGNVPFVIGGNCPTAIVTTAPASLNCSNLGANSVVTTVSNGVGDMNSCTSTVTVLDTIKPMAVCQNASIAIMSGVAALAPSQIDGGSSDNCTAFTLSASQTSFNCSNIGTNTVTLTVTDGSMNTKTCTATVTVTGAVAPPTGSSPQVFCSAVNPKISDLAVTGANILWYDMATGGTLLPTSTPLVHGTIYYASQTTNGCESTTRLAITATVNVTPAAPTGASPQVYCSATNPKISDLTVVGSNILWYDMASGGSLLPTTTPLVNGVIYYASQTTNGCESTTRLAITATVNVTPAAPTGASPQVYCSSTNPKISDFAVTGSNILWYDMASGGSLLPTTTPLVNGVIYYASQTTNNCESTTRLAVTATVNVTPAAPTGASPQVYCSATNPKISDFTVVGSNILWYDMATGGSLLPTSTPLVNGVIYYASQTTNGCESTNKLAITATVNVTPAAPVGNPTQAHCAGTNPTVANLLIPGTGVLWYATASGGSPLPLTTPLVDGATYHASQVVNGCESVTRFAMAVTLTPSPLAPTGATAQNFCSENSPTVANLSATGTAVKWYATASGGTVLPSNTPLTNGATYYASQTANNCESIARLAVTATIIPTPPAPTGTTPQGFCSADAPTVANLSATGTGIQWYANATGGSPLPPSTPLVNGAGYYAGQTVGGCGSANRLFVAAFVRVTPPAPAGAAVQQFAQSSNPTLANLSTNGEGVKWYDMASGGAQLPINTPLVDGMHYYASQTVNGCPSASRLDVQALLIPAPPPPTGPSPQTFVSGNNPTIADLIANGMNIEWFSSPTGGMPLPPWTPLVAGQTYYATQTVNGVRSSGRLAVMVIINISPAPPTGFCMQIFCIGENPTVGSLVATGQNIQWYANATGGSPLAPNTPLVNGLTYHATQTVNGIESVPRFPVMVTVRTPAPGVICIPGCN